MNNKLFEKLLSSDTTIDELIDLDKSKVSRSLIPYRLYIIYDNIMIYPTNIKIYDDNIIEIDNKTYYPDDYILMYNTYRVDKLGNQVYVGDVLCKDMYYELYANMDKNNKFIASSLSRVRRNNNMNYDLDKVLSQDYIVNGNIFEYLSLNSKNSSGDKND